MRSRIFSLGLLASGLASLAPAAECGLVVDFAQSRVDVVVRVTVDSFSGHLSRYEPKVMFADDGRITSARLRFHFRDVVTGKGGRDKSMHAWQHTDEFPDGEFVLSSIEQGDGGTLTAFGRLTFHGLTRDLRFPISINRDGVRCAIDGDAAIDTREFGLPIIRMMAVMKVDPVVHVRFHLQGAIAPRPEGSP
jgi:polyisoprenoid-binding protein YceI